MLQLIRRELGKAPACEDFNDLLIISHIVPKLPHECLTQMICFLRPILDLSIKTPQSPISLAPLIGILARAPVQDPLLSDFLAVSGHTPVPC